MDMLISQRLHTNCGDGTNNNLFTKNMKLKYNIPPGKCPLGRQRKEG
jgi:hypothetical protein